MKDWFPRLPVVRLKLTLILFFSVEAFLEKFLTFPLIFLELPVSFYFASNMVINEVLVVLSLLYFLSLFFVSESLLGLEILATKFNFAYLSGQFFTNNEQLFVSLSSVDKSRLISPPHFFLSWKWMYGLRVTIFIKEDGSNVTGIVIF